ncbi:MAG: hypothetical protein LBU04_03520 [Christensenellaceae bacterium]|jgi:hypothetical protein|nr:hypothetical protein [Christensenellaceae bacterium]
MKKLIITIALILTTIIGLMTLSACKEPPVTPPSSEGAILTPLDALLDYSSNASFYDTYTRFEYEGNAITEAEQLNAKIESEKIASGFNANTFEWNDDVSTAKKIFTFSTGPEIIDRFEEAGLRYEKAKLLVNYITRQASTAKYELQIGTGDFLSDYDQLNELNDLYDENENLELTVDGETKFIYEVVQLKRYKILGELVKIFSGDGDQAARTAIEIIAYAQEVVTNKMIPAYNDAPNKAYVVSNLGTLNLESFTKEVLFDYDTLVYFLVFAEKSQLNDTFQPTVKKDLVKLFGYYYLYERSDYNFWSITYSRANYVEYLSLSMKEYFSTIDEARKYTKYDRDHYAKAYRYSDVWYEDYYKTHFNFQQLIEEKDKKIYRELDGRGNEIDMSDAFSTLSAAEGGKTYSEQMKTAIENKRLTSNLLVSDINYEYTGVDKNVVEYQKVSYDYYTLSEALRDVIENDTASIRPYIDDIKYVNLKVNQLKSQYYTISHAKIATAGEIKHISNVLIYQIHSYNADYIRGMQSYKKSNVVLLAEIKREENKASPDLSIIREKNDEIGRNNIMKENMQTNFARAATKTQVETARNHNWTLVAQQLKVTITLDYNAFHNEITSGNTKRYNDLTAIQVKTYFEDTLIKRKWTIYNSALANPNEPEVSRTENNGWKKEYDTDHDISRVLNAHDMIIRHANSQLQITYNDAFDAVYKEYKNVPSGTASTINDFTLTTNDNYITWSYAYNGSGVFSATLNNLPTKDKYNRTFKTETLDNSAKPALAFWDNSFGTDSESRWKGTATDNGFKSAYYLKNDTYDGISFMFAGWFLDPQFKYIARPTDTYDYDISLYPAFFVVKSTKV